MTVVAQGRGAIAGQVTGQGGVGLVGARVSVVGTSLRAVTGDNGTYRIANVPTGAASVTAQMLGYSPRTQRVTVLDGGIVTATFALEQAPLQITGIVVTATGREQSTREIGSSVGLLNTADVPMAATTSASDLLAGKVTGVVVTQSSGTTGGGARIRIRGANSMSLSNNPLIIVDGIRVENSENSLTTTVGGQAPSRFNDLNPDDIESIEVLKGPAAAALYGTAAANGVIQVTTKRGQAGKASFRAWTETGTLRQPARFPDNVLAVDATGAPCDIISQSLRACTVSQTFTFNPLENPATSPFQKGNRQAVGASVSGGSDAATYYVSSTYNQEQGVLPQNNLHRIQVQANTTGRIGDQLNVGANVSYMNNRSELPLSDNALFGILGMGLYGYPDPASVASTQGYANDPAFFYDWKTFQNYARITGSVRGEYHPISWLSFNGNAGVDRYAREDRNRIPRTSAYSPFGSVYTHGYIDNFNFDINDLTSNGAATAIFDLPRSVVSTTSVGSQYIREILHRVEAFGAGLIPGVEESLAGATSDYFAGETNTLNGTLSAYVQQQFAWRDRVFLNAAVRTDKNTAFGRNIGWITYPSLSGSWIISDEGFFPRISALNSLRLRAAYGKAGLRPGPTDALLSFTPLTTTFLRNDVGAFTFGTGGSNTLLGSLGNANLKPEKSSELELGFEAQTLNNRLNAELTYFNKTSRDALVSAPLAPSAGSGATQFVNVGRVDNKGVEFRLTGSPLKTSAWEWNASLGGSVIDNKLVTLGTTAAGTPLAPVILGLISTQRHVEGYPLGGYWQRPIISYADANGDGLLSPSEVKVDTARRYLGTPFPRRELTFSTDLHFRDFARLSALVDWKGGQKLLNFTKAFRCNAADTFNCAQLYDPKTPLDQQAAMVAIATTGSYAGFVEDASFAKLREVALTLNLLTSLATRVRTQGLSLTFAGRNLHTWTKYTGLDPELNFNGQSLFSTGDAATLPANRLFQVRLDANF